MFTIIGSTESLQGELNAFTYVLIHAESHMRKTIAENMQVHAWIPTHNTYSNIASPALCM